MTAVLIDTNLLVYAHDIGEVKKHARALQVLERLHDLSSGRLTVQMLAEFFSAVRRGSQPLLSEAEAAAQVDRLARAWPILPLTSMIVLEAVRGVRQHRLAYWDAQIWATAHLNQIPVIFSEDFQSGRTVEGVKFVNPLAEDFDLDQWS